MIRVAICDDEKQFCDAAEGFLSDYRKEKELSCQGEIFSSSSALLDATEAGVVYDVYLLDIYMPGVTGMSIATELRSRGVKSPIIFLTSSTDHALEAFGVDATHYLLKPYTKENFFVGMDKAVESLASHKADGIVLKVEGEYRSISVSTILYCEAADKYQRVYLENGEKLLVRISGGELYKLLSQFESFYHCGRAHIMNLDHVRCVTGEGAVFQSGAVIKLPHTVLAGLRSAFFDYFN